MSSQADRVLSVLEFLARKPENAFVLPEVSRGLGAPPASCARILSTLVRRGYAEKVGSRGGYRMGPMAYALPAGGVYMKSVRETAAPAVEECAGTLGAHVLLGARRGDNVYKVAEFDGSPEITVRTSVLEGLYNSATGRLLLSFSGEKSIENYLRSSGLPSKKGGGRFSLEEIIRELSVIRSRGYSLKMSEALAAFAFPVRYGREYLGLGCSMLLSKFRGKNREMVLEAVERTAGRIETELERRKIWA